MRAGVTVGNDSARPRNYDAMAARIVGGMTSREVSEANGKKFSSILENFDCLHHVQADRLYEPSQVIR